MVSLAEVAERILLFQDLPKLKQYIAERGKIVSFQQGDVIAKESTDADRFFVIVDGRLALQVLSEDKPVQVECLGVQELIGWSWLVPPHCWSFDVVALTDGAVCSVPTEGLQAVCSEDAEFAYQVSQRFAQIMSTRLIQTRHRLAEVAKGNLQPIG